MKDQLRGYADKRLQTPCEGTSAVLFVIGKSRVHLGKLSLKIRLKGKLAFCMFEENSSSCPKKFFILFACKL